MPRLRRAQDTLEFLRGFTDYDPFLSSDQNAKALREEIVVDAGVGKIAFPFSFFYGQGVLTADFSDEDRPFGVWYKTPLSTFAQTSNYIEFKT